MPSNAPVSREPLFSVIAPCYNVARYLDEFIDSLEAQEIDDSDLEFIMVDDGSTDETLEHLLRWEARRPGLVRVISQQNGGQASARNTGIENARGTWVTFPDPDDFLDPDYFSRVKKMIVANPGIDMVATNRWLYNDVTKESTNSHPLRSHFVRDAVYNLAVNDSFFQGGSVCSFFRRERLMAEELRYDVRLRPTFEDGHFVGVYLLPLAEPKVGYLGTRYHYRKRADGTSTLQNALSHPGRYTNVLEHGSLDLLRRGQQMHPTIPLWLQNLIIYEVNHYVGREDSAAGTLAPVELWDAFHHWMGEITALLENEAVDAYRRTRLSAQTRDLIKHGWTGETWHSEHVKVTEWDQDQKLVRLVYRWTGEAPTEELTLGARAVTPYAAKQRSIRIQGRTVMHERIIWVPDRRVRVRLNGVLMNVLTDTPNPSPVAVRTQDLAWIDKGTKRLREKDDTSASELTLKDRLLLRRSQGRRARQRFEKAWVLQDRIHNAEDNAEHLFRHLRRHHEDVNAWFVLEAGTPCHTRMKAEFGDRVVAFGSDEWAMLMINAVHLISSHADMAVTNPVALRQFKLSPRYTFLQHGVTKDDLSGWLNQRSIRTLVASTQAEFDAFTQDETSYRVTEKEVVLSGMPRFDALTRTNRRYPPDQRDLVLLSPTWRDYLSLPLQPGSQERHAVPNLHDSVYWKSWMGLLESEELREAAEKAGLQVAILPHPNLENAFKGLRLPGHVRQFTFGSGLDVADLFSRSAVMVTDFSSTAFDAAYIERPIVYFHCDVEPGVKKRHVGVPGYFDYERDGFGPVVHTVVDAVTEISATLAAGPEPRAPWLDRIRSAYPQRDEENCARVVRAIKRGSRPAKGLVGSADA